uniref:Uncharacterized protein n=1 Tax=Romanomermis culicivorax TaxID=13658 RepID=A0A915KDW2_ROMCU
MNDKQPGFIDRDVKLRHVYSLIGRLSYSRPLDQKELETRICDKAKASANTQKEKSLLRSFPSTDC